MSVWQSSDLRKERKKTRLVSRPKHDGKFDSTNLSCEISAIRLLQWTVKTKSSWHFDATDSLIMSTKYPQVADSRKMTPRDIREMYDLCLRRQSKTRRRIQASATMVPYFRSIESRLGPIFLTLSWPMQRTAMNSGLLEDTQWIVWVFLEDGPDSRDHWGQTFMRVDCVDDLRKKSVLDKMFDWKLHLANKCTRSLTPNPQPFVLSEIAYCRWDGDRHQNSGQILSQRWEFFEVKDADVVRVAAVIQRNTKIVSEMNDDRMQVEETDIEQSDFPRSYKCSDFSRVNYESDTEFNFWWSCGRQWFTFRQCVPRVLLVLRWSIGASWHLWDSSASDLWGRRLFWVRCNCEES